jgi:hypothetical protein
MGAASETAPDAHEPEHAVAAAAICSALGQMTQARHLLSALVRRAPRHADGLAALGLLEYHLGHDWGRASVLLQSALLVDPQHQQARAAFEELLGAQAEPETPDETADESVEDADDSVEGDRVQSSQIPEQSPLQSAGEQIARVSGNADQQPVGDGAGDEEGEEEEEGLYLQETAALPALVKPPALSSRDDGAAGSEASVVERGEEGGGFTHSEPLPGRTIFQGETEMLLPSSSSSSSSSSLHPLSREAATRRENLFQEYLCHSAGERTIDDEEEM